MIQNKPVIGIIPTFNLENKDNDPYQDRASFVSMYADKIRNCGGIPIGILDKDIDSYLELCDGYIWPGGNKIWSDFYKILEDAIKNKKPVLGICMGAQAIATFFNILEDLEKYEDLSFRDVYEINKKENPYLIPIENSILHNHYVTKDKESIESAKHKIKIEKKTFLYDIYKTLELDVVSLHSYKIARVSKDIIVSAKAIDDVIEAVEYHKEHAKILGVQFHPEIVEDDEIFHWLLKNTMLRK